VIKTLLALILLPTYGNVFNLIHARLKGHRQTVLAWGAPLSLLAFSVAAERFAREAAELVVPEGGRPIPRTGQTRWNLALGTVAGAALAALPALWFRLPGRAAVWANELRTPVRALLCRIFVVTPLLVATAEEAAFRGFLQERLHRTFPGRPTLAVILSSLSFAAWHVTVNVRTLRRTNVVGVGAASIPIAVASGLGAVFAGGLVFGALYRYTRNLVAPVVAHWVVDALILCALYEWRPPARDLRGSVLEETLPNASRTDRPQGVGPGEDTQVP
jgi:membrane protease YdiL (CAAX protease family)